MLAEGTVDLLRSVLRAGRWWPAVTGAATGVVIVLVPLLLGLEVGYLDATTLLHLSLAVTVCGAAFTLDDPTRSMSSALPVSPVRVALVRMAAASAVILASWVVQLVLAPHVIDATVGPYPGMSLFVEAPAVLVWTWLAAWVATARRVGGDGSSLAAPAVVIVMLTIGFLPDAAALFLAPADEGFAASRVRWVVILVAGVLSLGAALRRRR